MNRKALLKLAKRLGFKGATLSELKAWANENGYGAIQESTDSPEIAVEDFDGIWAKTVTVVADAGEDVVVEESGADTAMEDEDEIDGKEGEDDEDEAVEKSVKGAVSKQHVKQNRDAYSVYRRANAEGSTKRHGFDRDLAGKKNYDRAVREGTRLTKTNAKPLFYSADRAEAFGAAARLVALDGKSYSQRDNDERIAAKTGLLGQNSTGGALVFAEYLPELIENLEEYGVMRNAIGVTSMRDGEQVVSKLGSDVSITDSGEAEALTEDSPVYGNVRLVAAKTGILSKVSSELMHDSAFNVGDIIGRSILRARGQFEDQSVLLGSNNRLGFANLVGANSTFDAALTSDWSDYTLSDIQDWLAKIPAWAWKDPNFGIVCSLPFYMRVLRRFAQSAGGNTGPMLHSGVGPGIAGGILSGFEWDGIKVHISQALPQSYQADQLTAYAGALGQATKFGVVNGSERMDSSDQRYFDQDLIAFRMVQRWTFNGHDVNNTTNSGIVALQD